MDHLLKARKKTKIKKAGVSRYIFQNELCRACSQHDMAYGDFEDLTRRIASNKLLRNKVFSTGEN